MNISGCTNSCGQHHTADIGFFGAERRAHGQPAPGYQMLLGGYVGQEQIPLWPEGACACRLRTPPRPRFGSYAGSPASDRPVRRFVDWLERLWWRCQGGGCRTSRTWTNSPPRTRAPEFYVDYDETGPYVAEIGESECAT